MGLGVWLFWRRLWLYGLAYVALAAVALFGLIHLVIIPYIDTISALKPAENQVLASFRLIIVTGLHLFSALFSLGFWTIPVFLLFGILGSLPSQFGTAWYYRYCNHRIEGALKQYRTEEAAAKALSNSSGTSSIGAIFSIALLVAMVMTAFNIQASTKGSSEDEKWAAWTHNRTQTHAELKNRGLSLYANLGRWSPESRKIPLVITEADAVVMKLYFKPDNPANVKKAIIYHPIQRANGSIEWACSSRGFDRKLLPATCRDLK